MADTKVSNLTALAGSGVDASADVLAIVDTNVTTTKKISYQGLMDAVNTLTELTSASLSAAADFIPVFNVADSKTKKLGVDDLAVQLPARKNAIINGDFNVWQRGTSFTSIATSTYSADRWIYNKTGAMVHDVSRSTDVPTVAEAGRLFNYSILVDCTTVDSSIAAGDYTLLQQYVEGYNWLPLAQRAVTLSFWVKGTKTGIHCVSLVNSGVDRSCVKEYTINTTDTWEKKTLTFPASPSAGTWDYTTGIGVRVSFALAMGSTFHTTADAYQTGSFFATANQVNATDSTSNNFYLCGVQLEAGSVATEIEQRTFNEELALCQRYYAKTFDYSVAPVQNVGNVNGALTSQAISGTNGPGTDWRFPVMMRAAPTVTTYNPHAADANWRDIINTTSATVAAGTSTTSGVGVVSSGAVTNTHFYAIHAQAVAEL